MAAMGGRANWDATRYITWRFFGFRLHVWDKWTGNIRFEQGDLTVLMNIHSKEGRAFAAGAKISDPDTLAAKLDHGYRAYINDSYWLVMPYKLKDTGVTLRYRGLEATEDGRPAEVLELTFKDVGVTPQNKYAVWIDQESRLVTQWAFYREAADAEPALYRPLDQLATPRIHFALRRSRRAPAHRRGGLRRTAALDLHESRTRCIALAFRVGSTTAARPIQ